MRNVSNMTVKTTLVEQRSHHDIISVPTYSFLDIARITTLRSLQQGQRPNQGHNMMLHTYNPETMSVPCFLLLLVSEISPKKILKIKVTPTRSKVNLMSNHDIAHLQCPINVPAKYKLLIPFSFFDIVWTPY